MDHNRGSNGAYHQLAEYETENPPSTGFPSFQGLGYSTEQVPWSTEVVPTLPLQATDEGQASPPAAFDIDTWNTLLGPRDASEFPYFPAPLASGGSLAAPQEAYVSTDPPEYFDVLNGVNMQTFQAETPYASDVSSAHRLGNELVQARELRRHVYNTTRGPFGSNEDIGGFIDVPGPIIDVNPRGANANTPFCHSNATTQGGWMNTSGVPTHNGPSTSTLSLRLRGPRSPPQTYEGDVVRLYNRLIDEGADIGTAMVLRFIIFADGVTIDALMAPIETPEVVRAFGGATRMWGLLFETKETVTGKKKYGCLLCPPENRREYGHNRDAVRHFNKDHFGFKFPCDYCNRQFFKNSEERIHVKKCKYRPSVSA